MKLIYIIISIFFLPFLLLAQDIPNDLDSNSKVEYYKVCKVRIFVEDKSEILNLRMLGIVIDRVKYKDGYIDAFLDTKQKENLANTKYPYKILIEDVTKDYLERTKGSREEIKKLKKIIETPCGKRSFGYGSMGGFYTFDEVVAELDNMHSLYPDLITEKESAGSSIEGRPIWIVKISDNPTVDEDESEVFYNSLIHAREAIGMMAVISFMYYLLENYGSDPEVTYLVNNRELFFMPVVNPDSYVYNETISPDGGGMWRKNRRDNGDGSFGVDLNTNFGYKWGYNDLGSSPLTNDIRYRGTRAFSESETSAIFNLCLNHEFVIGINYHSYWNTIFAPWGYNLKQTKDSTKYNLIINLATSLNGYSNGFDEPDAYEVNGDVCDWMHGETGWKNKIYGFLPEVGNDDDGFWPIPERIFPLAEENIYPNLVYAWGLGIIENPPYPEYAHVFPKFVNFRKDSITISVNEINPDGDNSIILATLINEFADTVHQMELTKYSENLFSEKWNSGNMDETFYSVIIKQSGIEKPSNFYYTNKQELSFTTAGPIAIDTFTINYQNDSLVIISDLYLHNYGSSKEIFTVSAKLISLDSSVIAIPNAMVSFGKISPGETRKAISTLAYVPKSTSDSSHFKLEISSGNIVYWIDTLIIKNEIVDIQEVLVLPLEFVLEQSYPNPFNPSSTIKYSIPRQCNVTLKVFDLLGGEVSTLVNKEQSQGNYEVDFDGSKLTSGIYFYRLQAGDLSTSFGQSFVETKKMVLLK